MDTLRFATLATLTPGLWLPLAAQAHPVEPPAEHRDHHPAHPHLRVHKPGPRAQGHRACHPPERHRRIIVVIK